MKQTQASTVLVVSVCIAYLVVLAWSMGNTTYDSWGVLVVLPPLGFLGVVLVRRMFTGEFRNLVTIMTVGLVVKLIGTGLRYWVGFEAYQGSIDAQRYHEYATVAATDLWSGRISVFSLFPGGAGTPATEGVTALLYALTGPSKMGGFVVFGFIGFVGTACFVKAACIAVPGLATRRYALLCVLAPSLVYWPSSIGKDALMIALLGVATLGIARLVAEPKIVVPLVLTAGGLAGAAFIRPHLVGVWLAGLFPALLVTLVRGRDPRSLRQTRSVDRMLMVPVVAVALVGLIAVSVATVQFLDPSNDDPAAESGVTSILEETTRRTEQAGSSFVPPSISSPANWPYAAVRTLTRPLLVEARGSAQLFTALELTIFLGLCLVSIRRLMHLPKLVIRLPYVAFAVTTLFLAGLAFSSFANLAILARQRSLIFPFLLLLVCVPPLPRRPAHDPVRTVRPDDLSQLIQKSSMSPSVNAQLDSGGSPRSLTARQVRTGPPPGRGAKAADGRG